MLINCPECGKEISDQSNTCPNCGHVLKNPLTTGQIIIRVLGGLLLLFSLLSFFGVKFQPKVQIDVQGDVQIEPIEDN